MQRRQTKVDISGHLLGCACLNWDLEIREFYMQVRVRFIISGHSRISVAAKNNANMSGLEDSINELFKD